ncbi:MAG: hypothetical protein ACREJO_17715 [Phycisphaerales bacterium]
MLASAALALCAAALVNLYLGPAPFHQHYARATAAQNATVTTRMIAGLVGVPLGVICVTAALAGPHILSHPRRWLLVLAGLCLLGALQAWLVQLSLPYGFGSSYEHASPDQLVHLHLSGMVGTYAIALAAALAVLSILVPAPTTLRNA